MKNKKTIPTSLLKEISDKNHKTQKTGYSIDMDMLMAEHPEMTEIEFYEPAVYRGNSGKLCFQVCFVNPGRGLWLSQSMTKSQVQQINKLTGANLFDIENVYELQN
jgi:hypothetical protein